MAVTILCFCKPVLASPWVLPNPEDLQAGISTTRDHSSLLSQPSILFLPALWKTVTTYKGLPLICEPNRTVLSIPHLLPNFNSSSIISKEKPSSSQGLAKLQSRHMDKVNQRVWLKSGLNPGPPICNPAKTVFSSPKSSHPKWFTSTNTAAACSALCFFSYSTWKDFEAKRDKHGEQLLLQLKGKPNIF